MATRTWDTTQQLEGGRRWVWSYTGTCAADDVLLLQLADWTVAPLLAVFVRGAAPATTLQPELHSSATPSAATLVKDLDWGSTTPGLVYQAGDGPDWVRLTADGEVWIRPQPDATCTLTVQVVMGAH